MKKCKWLEQAQKKDWREGDDQKSEDGSLVYLLEQRPGHAVGKHISKGCQLAVGQDGLVYAFVLKGSESYRDLLMKKEERKS